MDDISIHVGKYEYKSFDNSLWVKIFYHNSATSEYFADSSEALQCNSINKFSILSEIKSSHRINSSYEFILIYPSYNPQFNRWRQKNAPHQEIEVLGMGKVAGYEPIHIDWSDKGWRGLAVSTIPIGGYINSFIDGAEDSAWYYAIGKFVESYYDDNTFPGPTGSVYEVILWMRITGYDICDIYTQKNSFKCISHITILMFHLFYAS